MSCENTTHAENIFSLCYSIWDSTQSSLVSTGFIRPCTKQLQKKGSPDIPVNIFFLVEDYPKKRVYFLYY
mgnify:CR=1 FL=1